MREKFLCWMKHPTAFFLIEILLILICALVFANGLAYTYGKLSFKDSQTTHKVSIVMGVFAYAVQLVAWIVILMGAHSFRSIPDDREMKELPTWVHVVSGCTCAVVLYVFCGGMLPLIMGWENGGDAIPFWAFITMVGAIWVASVGRGKQQDGVRNDCRSVEESAYLVLQQSTILGSSINKQRENAAKGNLLLKSLQLVCAVFFSINGIGDTLNGTCFDQNDRQLILDYYKCFYKNMRADSLAVAVATAMSRDEKQLFDGEVRLLNCAFGIKVSMNGTRPNLKDVQDGQIMELGVNPKTSGYGIVVARVDQNGSVSYLARDLLLLEQYGMMRNETGLFSQIQISSVENLLKKQGKTADRLEEHVREFSTRRKDEAKKLQNLREKIELSAAAGKYYKLVSKNRRIDSFLTAIAIAIERKEKMLTAGEIRFLNCALGIKVDDKVIHDGQIVEFGLNAKTGGYGCVLANVSADGNVSYVQQEFRLTEIYGEMCNEPKLFSQVRIAHVGEQLAKQGYTSMQISNFCREIFAKKKVRQASLNDLKQQFEPVTSGTKERIECVQRKSQNVRQQQGINDDQWRLMESARQRQEQLRLQQDQQARLIEEQGRQRVLRQFLMESIRRQQQEESLQTMQDQLWDFKEEQRRAMEDQRWQIQEEQQRMMDEQRQRFQTEQWYQQQEQQRQMEELRWQQEEQRRTIENQQWFNNNAW